jgi:hypothetical protein
VKRVEKLNRYLEEFFENILEKVGRNVHCEDIINQFFSPDDTSFIPDAFSFETCGGDFRKQPKIPLDVFKFNFCYSHMVDVDDMIKNDELEEVDKISFKEYVKFLTESRKTAYLILKNEKNTKLHQFNSKRRVPASDTDTSSSNTRSSSSSSFLEKQKISRKRRPGVFNKDEVLKQDELDKDVLLNNTLNEFESKLTKLNSFEKLQKIKQEKELEIQEFEHTLIVKKKELTIINSILSEMTKREAKKKIKKSTNYYLETNNEENLKVLFKKVNMETQNKFYEPISPSNAVYEEKILKSGNIYKLVYHLTSEKDHDNEYDHRFLLTYRSFCTSDDLLNLLIFRYNTLPPKSISPKSISHHSSLY